MKNLILLLVLFVSFSIIAQNKVESNNAQVSNQTDKWMTKISSDPELRSKMIDIIIMKTKGNEEEMQTLVNSLLADPELSKMITKTNTKRANNETVYIEHHGIISDSIKAGKINSTVPMSKK